MGLKNLPVWCKTNLNLKKTFTGFPVECACFIGTVLSLLMAVMTDLFDIICIEDDLFILSGLWLFIFGFISYLFNVHLKNRFRVIYYVLLPSLIIALVAGNTYSSLIYQKEIFDYKTGLGLAVLMFLCMMVPWGNKFDNQAVVRNIIEKIAAVLLSAVPCLLVLLPIGLVFEADIDFFYDSDMVLTILTCIVVPLVFPFLFMNMYGKISFHGIAHSKWMQIIFNYILSPLVMIGLFIFLVYSIYGLIDGAAMKEHYFVLTFSFFIFSFVCLWVSSYQASTRWKKIYSFLHIFLLPVLVWAWYSIISEHVSSYFSETSIVKMAVLLLLTVYVLSLFFRKFNFNLVLVISVAALMSVCLTMVPAINTESLETRSIEAQCERMIAENNLLTGETVNESACYALNYDTRTNLVFLLNRLSCRGCQKDGWNELAGLLGRIEDDGDYGESTHYVFDQSYIDVEAYSRMLSVSGLWGNDIGETYVDIFTDDELDIAELRMSDVEAHVLRYLDNDSTATDPDGVFLYPVGNYVIVLKDIIMKDRHICDFVIWDYAFMNKPSEE